MSDNQKNSIVATAFLLMTVLMLVMGYGDNQANIKYNADCVANGGEIIKRQGETVCAKVEVLK